MSFRDREAAGALLAEALVVRKLGVPWEPEVAFGALGPEGVCVLNQDIAAQLPPEAVQTVLWQEAV